MTERCPLCLQQTSPDSDVHTLVKQHRARRGTRTLRFSLYDAMVSAYPQGAEDKAEPKSVCSRPQEGLE